MGFLGFSGFDITLIILCSVGGVIGSFAHAILETIDPLNSPKKDEDMTFASEELQEKRESWLILRFILGAILGLVVGLYFVGSIQENSATAAKILALSILAGYAAPKIWEAQDKIVEAKIKQLM